jgi:predicted CXXCH cytochrome family protein
MKKFLVAAAMALFATTASAAIAGSSHDFSGTTWLTTAPAYSCKGCHTAHGATMTSTIIWARAAFTTVGLTVYSAGSTLDAKQVGACLACHNNTAANLKKALTTVNFGTDLRNEHPVGSLHITGSGGKWQPTPTIGGVAANGVSMDCSSCHTVHNDGTKSANNFGRYLLRNYTGANICVGCHAY